MINFWIYLHIYYIKFWLAHCHIFRLRVFYLIFILRYYTIFMKLNLMTFRTFKQKNKKMRIIYMTKNSFRAKLQIKKRCSTTIQRYVEKKIQNITKKKWKNINYETIKISSTDFKNEKFYKIDELQNFQTFWMKKKTKQQFDDCANQHNN